MARTVDEDGFVSSSSDERKKRQKVAHLNEEGTAHEWDKPGHGGIRVPGGEVNPHGRRGGKTWGDGRKKYDKDGNMIIGQKKKKTRTA